LLIFNKENIQRGFNKEKKENERKDNVCFDLGHGFKKERYGKVLKKRRGMKSIKDRKVILYFR